MTLKEKFHQCLKTEPFNSRDRVTLREAQCVVIADEFAIGFLNWYAMHGSWIEENLTTKQLLEIYKKEKGL